VLNELCRLPCCNPGSQPVNNLPHIPRLTLNRLSGYPTFRPRSSAPRQRRCSAAAVPEPRASLTSRPSGPGPRVRCDARSCPRLRRRELGLPFNAVVHCLAFDAPGLNVLAVTDAVRFRQLERARFTPFVHSWLTRARKRSVVRGRKVCAPGDQSRTSQDYPFHVRVSRVCCPKLEWLSDAKDGRWRGCPRQRTKN
jgi:hypothetical protein